MEEEFIWMNAPYLHIFVTLLETSRKVIKIKIFYFFVTWALKLDVDLACSGLIICSVIFESHWLQTSLVLKVPSLSPPASSLCDKQLFTYLWLVVSAARTAHISDPHPLSTATHFRICADALSMVLDHPTIALAEDLLLFFCPFLLFRSIVASPSVTPTRLVDFPGASLLQRLANELLFVSPCLWLATSSISGL